MAPAPGGPGDLSEGDLSIFNCALCSDLVVQPVTLPCCGETFCRSCLQAWLAARLGQDGIARCPAAACRRELPARLPATNTMLEACLRLSAPEAVERRRLEVLEGEVLEMTLGDFRPWQDVRSTAVLHCGDVELVAAFQPGVVLATTLSRVKVKFDSRLDGRVSPISVAPEEIVPELPRRLGFVVGQPVVASRDLYCNETQVCSFGTAGTVRRQAVDNPERIWVDFSTQPPTAVNVLPEEICPAVVLGFRVASRVCAAQDLFAEERLLTRQGTPGVVQGPFSDTRLTVAFDDGPSAGTGRTLLNVTPKEIRRL